jgi:hypothetical protein
MQTPGYRPAFVFGPDLPPQREREAEAKPRKTLENIKTSSPEEFDVLQGSDRLRAAKWHSLPRRNSALNRKINNWAAKNGYKFLRKTNISTTCAKQGGLVVCRAAAKVCG